jgi:ferrous iron transport protein B
LKKNCCDNETSNQVVHNTNLTIAIAGNPNCGKSSLFNAFTGIRQMTGNWPGVTVERKEGQMTLDNLDVRVIDLPGIYSLDANSPDELVARNYLLSQDAELIVNLVDATNLERNLYLTVQLLEMGVPIVIALNMMDVARRRGIRIDVAALAAELGCPVIPIVAVTGEGLTALKARILSVASGQNSGGFSLAQDEIVEQAIADLMPYLNIEQPRTNSRWLALKLLEGDEHVTAQINTDVAKEVAQHQRAIKARCGEDTDLRIADSRFGHAHTLAQRVVRQQGGIGKTLTDRIDSLVLNRWLGVPIFLIIMYLMFVFTINVGGAFIDFFDGVGAAIFVDGFGRLLSLLGAPQWLRVLLAEGAGGGLQMVGTFIPIITCLYLFLSALEDSGYMARAAFVMDRSMRTIGLPGKAFVPLLVGFGCNVPAVMATRTLEHERERKLTILMNPFMSCGARLPVYALFAAAFFPQHGQNLVFGLYLMGIAVAILTGLAMNNSLLPGESSGFMMELPPYHLPTVQGIALRTWDRVKLFIREAGRVILVMVLILNVLNSIGRDGSFGNEDSEQSILSLIGKTVTPLFAPFGIQEHNWPATVGIFTGVLAKEAVVGTLNAIYVNLYKTDTSSIVDTWSLHQALSDAVATIPTNLANIRNQLADPLGLNIGDLTDQDTAALEQEVDVKLFGAMANRFDGQAGAFAYLLFILLYAPCAATIAVIVREAGSAWAAFVTAWTTGIAYIVATVFYQTATYHLHPATSLMWITSLLITLASFIVILRMWAYRDDMLGG